MNPDVCHALVVDLLAITIHEADVDFHILEATPAAMKVLGSSGRDVPDEGKPWLGKVHEDDRGRVVRGLHAAAREGSGELLFRFQIDQAWRWIRARCAALPAGEGKGPRLACVLEDATPREEAHRALRARMEALRQSNLELEQFASIASHDLTEPLRMVASFTRLLSERYAEALDEEGREFLSYALEGAERLQRMLADLLTYSRLGRATGTTTQFEAGGVLEATLSLLRTSLSESGAEVTVEGVAPDLAGVEAQFQMVLQNLIANALKFRSPHAPPRISFTWDILGEQAVVEVTDNGIGIDPAHHERVFGVFQKLHRPEEYPGTGLGLALCKRIVQRHGGEIEVNSAVGEGAAFRFTWPLAPVPQAASEGDRDSEMEGRRAEAFGAQTADRGRVGAVGMGGTS